MKTTSLFSYSLFAALAFFWSVEETHAQASNQDDGVDFQPIKDGGSRFIVRPPAFDVSGAPKTRKFTSKKFSLPASQTWLTSCYVVTPWLPAPSQSDLSVFPNIDMKWVGAIDLLSKDDVGLLNFVLETRRFGESEVKSQYFGIDTGMLDMTPVMFPDKNTCVYLGELQTSMDSDYPVVYRSSVPPETEIRAKFCGLTNGAEIDILGLTFQVLPKAK